MLKARAQRGSIPRQSRASQAARIICRNIADAVKRPSSEGRALLSISLVNSRSLRGTDQTDESTHCHRLQRHRRSGERFCRRQTGSGRASIHAEPGSGAADAAFGGFFITAYNKAVSRAANANTAKAAGPNTTTVGAAVANNLFDGDPLLFLAQ